MTDQEMVIRLGNYIIKLQRDISALEGVFTEYRIDTPDGRREIPYKEMAKKVAVEQRRSLLEAIGNETQGSALIRGLYREFLEE